MTEPEPFNFETNKRAKFSEVDQTKKDDYVPLWKQVKDSFQLREDKDQDTAF